MADGEADVLPLSPAQGFLPVGMVLGSEGGLENPLMSLWVRLVEQGFTVEINHNSSSHYRTNVILLWYLCCICLWNVAVCDPSVISSVIDKCFKSGARSCSQASRLMCSPSKPMHKVLLSFA